MRLRGLTRTFERVSGNSRPGLGDVPYGWFVIPHRLVETKLQRRALYGRWCRISSAEGEAFRVIRFSPSLAGKEGAETHQIVLDWAAWMDLHDGRDDRKEPMELTIETVRLYEILRLTMKHPDPHQRLSAWLGLLSIALGMVALALAVWSVVLAL